MLSNLDAVAFLESLESESVDLVLTDPAYESLEKHREIGTTTRLTDWFEIFPQVRMFDLFKQIYRVLKRDRHFYMISDWETHVACLPLAEPLGFTVWSPIVWDKGSIGTGYHWRSQYELVSFFEKGKRNLNDLSKPNVQRCKRIVGKGMYPTEKPPELLQRFIENSTHEGELVVDPFFGSGSTLIAAKRCARRYAGSDISPRAYAHASARGLE